MATFYYHYLPLLLLLKVVAFVFILVFLSFFSPFFFCSALLFVSYFIYLFISQQRGNHQRADGWTDGRTDEQWTSSGWTSTLHEFSLAVGWNLFLMVAAMV